MTRTGWILLLALTGLMILAWVSGVTDELSLSAIQARREQLLALVEARPLLSAATFVVAYAVIVALSLPAASIFTLLGGFLFGALLGGTLVIFAATMGASCVFLVARSSFGAALRQKAGPLAARVSRNIEDNAFEYLLSLRLVPIFPFFLVNILPALFGVRLATFASATLIGIIPGTFVYANLGRELGTISSLDDLVSWQLALAFALLGVIALAPSIWRRGRTGATITVSADRRDH